MNIEYSSTKLKKILEDPRLIKRYYGKNSTRLINRMSELKVAECLKDIPNVPPPRRHKLDGKWVECWGIDYSKNYRIIVKPIGEFDINDLSTMKSIKILELEDYH